MPEAMNAQSIPTWDLSDLYPAPDSATLQADLAEADKAAREFKDSYTGKLAVSPGSELAAAIKEYERIEEILGRVMSYAQLLFSSDSSNSAYGQFYQTMNERVTEIGSHLIFFTLELNRVDDATFERELKGNAGFERYRPWLRDLRVFRPHQL